jgi:hypothetical protein
VADTDGVLAALSAACGTAVNRLVFYGIPGSMRSDMPPQWEIRRSPGTHLWAVATTALERLDLGPSLARRHVGGGDAVELAVPGSALRCTVSPVAAGSESAAAIAREYATLMTQVVLTQPLGPVRVAAVVPQLAVLWADASGEGPKLRRDLAAEDAVELMLTTPDLARTITAAPDELQQVLRDAADAYLAGAAAPWMLARMLRDGRTLPALCDRARDHLRRLVAA